MLTDCGQLLLELYGAARALSVAEFPEFAFSLINSAWRFDSGIMRNLIPRIGQRSCPGIAQHGDSDDLWRSLSLNRAGPDDGCSQRDQRLLEALMPHVAEALRINEALGVRAAQADASVRDSLAFAAPDGVIHCAHPRFVELMRREWPQWPSTHLPACVLDGLRRVGGGGYTGRSIELSAQRSGELLFVRARTPNPPAQLSARERRVAALYGSGRSHKAIARELQLSPATVRNHLQRIYAKLGVKDKAQLAGLMLRCDGFEAGVGSGT